MFELLILGAATWLGSHAVPSVWKHHITQPTKQQIELSKDLCANHNDCSSERYWSTNPRTNDPIIQTAVPNE